MEIPGFSVWPMKPVSPVLSIVLVAALQAQISRDPAGSLSRYAIARFAGSGTDRIRAMTSDADGNVYVAGSTTSPDLPDRNAAQPTIGGELLMRSIDGESRGRVCRDRRSRYAASCRIQPTDRRCWWLPEMACIERRTGVEPGGE